MEQRYRPAIAEERFSVAGQQPTSFIPVRNRFGQRISIVLLRTCPCEDSACIRASARANWLGTGWNGPWLELWREESNNPNESHSETL